MHGRMLRAISFRQPSSCRQFQNECFEKLQRLFVISFLLHIKKLIGLSQTAHYTLDLCGDSLDLTGNKCWETRLGIGSPLCERLNNRLNGKLFLILENK